MVGIVGARFLATSCYEESPERGDGGHDQSYLCRNGLKVDLPHRVDDIIAVRDSRHFDYGHGNDDQSQTEGT